jgi:hypothetical protein
MTADPNAVALALQCRAVGLPEPQLEYMFDLHRKWRADLFFITRAFETFSPLAVEIEGGIWIKGGGGHNSPVGFLKNLEKYNEMTLAGIRLIRVTPAMVQDGTALGLIERAFGRGEAQP